MKLMQRTRNIVISACKYAIHKNTDKYVENILKIATFNYIQQDKPSKLESVVFVTPYMTRHSGGLTSVLRIAKRLSEFGLKVEFTCPTSDDCANMVENARSNLSEYVPQYITWEKALNNIYDFVIPVQDVMVYYARHLCGYLIYFVQDYEPYFNPVGDRYYLSKKAYELGEDIISLGEWNIQEIKRNISLEKLGNMYSIEFPFEATEYPLVEKDFHDLEKKNTINLAVYVKRESKRLPGIVMNMLEHVSRSLNNKGINLNIYYFGLHKVEKPNVGINLGRLSKDKIKELYAKCDFGMVASMTNISLVPYEMIGSGLPVIEFRDGSYPSFLGNDSAILLESFDFKELEEKIMYYRTNYKDLYKMTSIARERISGLSWDRSSKEFYDILMSITKNDV